MCSNWNQKLITWFRQKTRALFDITKHKTDTYRSTYIYIYITCVVSNCWVSVTLISAAASNLKCVKQPTPRDFCLCHRSPVTCGKQGFETWKIGYNQWLVGGWATPLKNMKVNWDDDIPNIWENKIDVPNHQPALIVAILWGIPHFQTNLYASKETRIPVNVELALDPSGSWPIWCQHVGLSRHDVRIQLYHYFIYK